MSKREHKSGWRFYEVAFIREGHLTHTKEAVSLACLLHSAGKERDSDEFKTIQKIMLDPNRD